MSDKIEPIPKTMEAFFGCSGDMVKPSTDTVKALVLQIPDGCVVTLDQLREKLAKNFSVQAACPASTTKALKYLSTQDEVVPYWRVIKKNGELLPQFPGSLEGHAELLEKDGFTIDRSGKKPKLADYLAKLYDLL